MRKILLILFTVFLVSCESNKKDVPLNRTISIQNIPEGYNPEQKLANLGIKLHELSIPKANYVHAVRTGNLIFLAGKGPSNEKGESVKGKLGKDLDTDQGYAASRLVGVQQLSALKAELGNLNKVKRIVKVNGMVNAIPEFMEHSLVINGFSDLMVEVFDTRGKHARAAVGMGSLPNNIAVEIEMVVEVFEY
ncbi:MAG: RidA family protein [Maribacter sp.]|nr:RidA family protein [Maribacter sp.]